MPMNWNEAADAKLFAGVLATSEGVKLKYDELANWMGNGCTAKAIQHRITNVRKMTKDSDTNVAAKTPKTPKTSGKRKAAKEDGNGDGENAGDAEDSPTKPKKARAPRKKATPKKVDAAGEDEAEDGMDGVKDESEEEVKIEDAGLVSEDA